MGRFHSAWSSARLTAATSAPALASSDGVMPCSWRSSATARCTGSIWGLPSLTARVPAALITSTLREVSFEASTSVLLVSGSGGRLRIVQVLSTPTRPKLSPFPSTLTNFRAPPATRSAGRPRLTRLASRPTRGRPNPPRVSLSRLCALIGARPEEGSRRCSGSLAHGFHLLLLVLGLAGVLAICSSPRCRRPPAPPDVRRTAHLRVPPSTSSASPSCAPPSRAVSSPPPSVDGALPAAGRRGTPRRGGAWPSAAASPPPVPTPPSSRTTSRRRWFVGLFFLVVTLAQAAWAVLVTLDATDGRLLVAGIVGSLGLVALWTVSRTVGPAVRSRPRARRRLGHRLRCLGAGRSWPPARSDCDDPRTHRALVMGDLGPLAWAWVALSGVVLVVLTPDRLRITERLTKEKRCVVDARSGLQRRHLDCLLHDLLRDRAAAGRRAAS